MSQSAINGPSIAEQTDGHTINVYYTLSIGTDVCMSLNKPH